MCRHLLLLLSLVLSFVSVGAQTQTVTLSGQLRSGTEPVAGAVLALLQPSDSSLLTYTISDSVGRDQVVEGIPLCPELLSLHDDFTQEALFVLEVEVKRLGLGLEVK